MIIFKSEYIKVFENASQGSNRKSVWFRILFRDFLCGLYTESGGLFLCVSAKVREINLFWHSNAPLSPFDMTHTSYPVSPSHFLFYFRVSLDHSPDPHTGSCLVTHPLPITSHTTPELTTWFQHLTSSCLQQLQKKHWEIIDFHVCIVAMEIGTSRGSNWEYIMHVTSW